MACASTSQPHGGSIAVIEYRSSPPRRRSSLCTVTTNPPGPTMTRFPPSSSRAPTRPGCPRGRPARASLASSLMPPRLASARTLLLPAFEGVGKGVESPFPQRTILVDPGIELSEGLGTQRIQTPRTVGPHAHEPGFFENAQM